MEQVPYSPIDCVALFFDLFETSSDAVYITCQREGRLRRYAVRFRTK